MAFERIKLKPNGGNEAIENIEPRGADPEMETGKPVSKEVEVKQKYKSVERVEVVQNEKEGIDEIMIYLKKVLVDEIENLEDKSEYEEKQKLVIEKIKEKKIDGITDIEVKNPKVLNIEYDHEIDVQEIVDQIDAVFNELDLNKESDSDNDKLEDFKEEQPVATPEQIAQYNEEQANLLGEDKAIVKPEKQNKRARWMAARFVDEFLWGDKSPHQEEDGLTEEQFKEAFDRYYNREEMEIKSDYKFISGAEILKENDSVVYPVREYIFKFSNRYTSGKKEMEKKIKKLQGVRKAEFTEEDELLLKVNPKIALMQGIADKIDKIYS